MASKSGRKTIFGKISSRLCRYLRVKNFVKITLSHSVSEINRFLRLTQKFKMVVKSSGKTIFAKKRQWTRQIPCRSKILLKSLYLTPISEINTLLCFKIFKVKIFVKTALSRSVSEINPFLRFQRPFCIGSLPKVNDF